jgi:hypothetical protein
MAVAQGYGKTVTSGSVFAYDTGDTSNSYRGEPTTNFVKNDSWGGDGVSQTLITKGKVTITDPTLQYKGLHTVLWAPGTSRNCYLNGAVPLYFDQTSTVWTFSCYLKREDGAPISGVNMYMYNIGSNTGVGTIQDVGDGWYRVSRTVSTAANYVSLVGFYNLVANTRYYLSGWQLEKKGHPTPVTALTATRSSTQGLLPLVGNSTIDLTNVSFDSNAQLIWDGTDDTLAVSDTVTHKPNTSFTYEIVFKPLGGGTFYDKMLIGKPGWHTGIMYQYSTIWFRTRYGSPAFYDTSGYSVTQGNYYHAVATYTSNTSMKFYVNGTLIGENNSVTTPLFDIGDTLNIGGSSVNYSSYVEIPAVKTYNRALSAAEVRQNYLHYKTRFNLS